MFPAPSSSGIGSAFACSTPGVAGLAEAKTSNRELREVQIVLPDIVIGDEQISLRLGRKTLELVPLPGHSPDGIGVLLTEDRVLFSGDAMMPLPSLVDGQIETSAASLRKIPRMKLENLVQGHGEVILRGEIPNAVRSNLAYLAALDRYVHRQQRRKSPSPLADEPTSGIRQSRILMNGLADEPHRRNLQALLRLTGRSR
jgi:glyoxylase-like metal-dependent hydrolase (beta-lactamase superfamily II)